MFFDELLQAAYEGATTTKGKAEAVVRCIHANLPPTPKSDKEYKDLPIRLKQLDNGFRLFKKRCDKENILKEDAFRIVLWKQYENPEKAARMFNHLGWPTL